MSLRNRIAFYFMAVTALFTVILYFVIYSIVFNTVYKHLDEDLQAELSEVSNSVMFVDGEMIFTNNYEWSEKEHGQIEVNPTFIQLVNTEGENIRKSANLINENLPFKKGIQVVTHFNLKVAGSSVRQIQAPLKSENGIIKAYLLIAIPLEESALVLYNLKYVLIISFPIVLILLFAVSRMIAGRIISPVNNIINTAEHITRENLNERIQIPPRNDELSKLTKTINGLLDRLEDAILREKQFTADASHELRTPISVIKGTLEVLIRKERTIDQYEEKIKYVIDEVDRMADLVEQLLLLARYESGKVEPMKSDISFDEMFAKILNRFNDIIIEKKIEVSSSFNHSLTISADIAMMEIILENLVSNALKYSNKDSSVEIKSFQENDTVILSLTNYGEAIPQENLSNIFDRFYRVDQNRTSIYGSNGLGLAIVKKLVDLHGFSISVKSDPQNRITFLLKLSN